MRKNLIVAGLLSLTAAGCAGTNAERGAVDGGILGGIAGLGVGILTGHPGAGAAIGAGLGAGTGAAVGNSQDRAERRAVTNAYANAMPLQQVVDMAQRNTPDDIIINQLNATGSFYQLTAADISYLRGQGVSDNVVRAMQTRVPGVGRPVVVAPPPPYGSVVIVEPPPPPVAVGVGFGFGGRHCR